MIDSVGFTFETTSLHFEVSVLTLPVSVLQRAPIDPFTRESCKPSASQGVPLGGMGCVIC